MSSPDFEVNTVLNELINTVAEESITEKVSDGNGNLPTKVDVSEFAEMADSESIVQTEDSMENPIQSSLRHQKKFVKKKMRSVSESQSELESQMKDVRRKFGSEGEILSICQKIFPPEQQKELNEAIENYISKLIKDSIFKAVQNVNVNNLYEDIINGASNRKNSQSTESEEEFTVEQRLNSDSISELVELEDAAESKGDKNVSRHVSVDSKSNIKSSETENRENEVDEASFCGYLADLDDTASVDDLKSIEGDSLNNSSCSGLENIVIQVSHKEDAEKSPCVDENVSVQGSDDKVDTNDGKHIVTENVNSVDQSEQKEVENIQNETNLTSKDNESDASPKLGTSQKTDSQENQENFTHTSTYEQDEKNLVTESNNVCNKVIETENMNKAEKANTSAENNENTDLIAMTDETALTLKSNIGIEDNKISPLDADESHLEQKTSEEERMKINWKVGNMHVKLPHKSRGKAHLKAWKKRRVVIQPDEFVNDPKNPSLVISVYSSDSKKHETTFWYSVSSTKAVVFRSSSRTHRYAFTISEGGQPIIHLSAENETTTQEWMAAIRGVLWPPSPFMELEKMLSGREFEVSIIDNEFSYHCGLLGMYGYLTITPKKLILIHPQQGYVIQEWYLNTVDKFQFVPQPKAEDEHKVLCMSACSDSSTGKGDIIFFCSESVTLLQSLASNIHQVLSYHSKQEGGKYQKELEEIAEWLVAPPQDCLNIKSGSEEHYKVPPRQVKSLLDIPNFIFNKSLSPVASAIYPAPSCEVMEPLNATRSEQITASHDSGISTCTSGEDFLNCSVTSFIIGGGPMTGKSSDSELSDAYTPPRTPEMMKKSHCEVVREEQQNIDE